jgi:hypothetical protein
MNFLFQRVLTQPNPVRFGKSQMQMPGLINSVRWSYASFGNAAQENEPFVLFNNAKSVLLCPAVFSGQPSRKIEAYARFIYLKILDFFPEKLLSAGHGVGIENER